MPGLGSQQDRDTAASSSPLRRRRHGSLPPVAIASSSLPAFGARGCTCRITVVVVLASPLSSPPSSPPVLASPRRLVVASSPVSSPASSPHRCPHLLAVAASSLPVQFGAVRFTVAPLFGAPRCTRVAIASSPRVVRSIVVASSSSSSSRRRVLAGVVFTSSLPIAKTVVVVSRFTPAPFPCASVTAVSARRRRRMKCSDACA